MYGRSDGRVRRQPAKGRVPADPRAVSRDLRSRLRDLRRAGMVRPPRPDAEGADRRLQAGRLGAEGGGEASAVDRADRSLRRRQPTPGGLHSGEPIRTTAQSPREPVARTTSMLQTRDAGRRSAMRNVPRSVATVRLVTIVRPKTRTVTRSFAAKCAPRTTILVSEESVESLGFSTAAADAASSRSK